MRNTQNYFPSLGSSKRCSHSASGEEWETWNLNGSLEGSKIHCGGWMYWRMGKDIGATLENILVQTMITTISRWRWVSNPKSWQRTSPSYSRNLEECWIHLWEPSFHGGWRSLWWSSAINYACRYSRRKAQQLDTCWDSGSHFHKKKVIYCLFLNSMLLPRHKGSFVSPHCF